MNTISGVLLVMKSLKDKSYVVINTNNFTVFEILRHSFVVSHIVCLCYPYRVYQLYGTSYSCTMASQWAWHYLRRVNGVLPRAKLEKVHPKDGIPTAKPWYSLVPQFD